MHQFDLLSADVEGTQTLNVEDIIKVLEQYPPPVISSYKKAHHVPCNEKPRALTVRQYTARLIDLNEYLASFPGATLNDKIGVTKLNEILLNSMNNSWYKQVYAQGFNCESIMFKKAVNMLERMKIAESIHEGVVEPSYKKPTREDANRDGHSRKKIGESALSWTPPRRVRVLKSAEKVCIYPDRKIKNLSHPQPRTVFIRM